jgi:5-methylcytosine-specific restriction endonuclease McrA
MILTEKKKRQIFDRTAGDCHLCGVRVAFRNYGLPGRRGARHIEHSVPKARGGSNHGNNIFAAHIECNLKKGVSSSRAARRSAGLRRSPLSAKTRRRGNAWAGGLLGGLFGLMGGPVGALIGTGIGASLGYQARLTKGS